MTSNLTKLFVVELFSASQSVADCNQGDGHPCKACMSDLRKVLKKIDDEITNEANG